MINPVFWIGCRETEIADCNYVFAGSITIFGSNKNNNRAFDKTTMLRYDYNQENSQWNIFVEKQIEEICLLYPNARFMLYSPEEVFLYGKELPKRIICQNEQTLLELLADKHRTRNWLSNCVPILPYLIRSGSTIHYGQVCQAFPGYTEFVAQEVYSCGGSGTYLISSPGDFQHYIEADSTYSISPYIKHSVSPNIHMIIYENEVLLLPPSVQLFSSGSESFHYQGADYVMYRHLSAEIKKKINDYAYRIGDRLRFAGYRGICGVDFLVDDEEVYLMEINARFQSSTFLINMAMKKAGINCSVHELHMDAFLNPSCTCEMPLLEIPYSFWSYSYNPQIHEQLRYVHHLHKFNKEVILCVDDELDWNMRLEQGTYLFKSIFYGNIAALSPEFQCRIHCNVNPKSLFADLGTWNFSNAHIWKIMLLNHGIRISENALKNSLDKGGFNFEEFEAVDMLINRQLCISVPYEANRSGLSPFEIDINTENQYQLCFMGHTVADIDLRYADSLGKNVTKNGFLYCDIAYLGNDRLRIYHRSGCYFKDNKIGCKFCDVEMSEKKFELNDIKEVLDAYAADARIRHYLIGGGSETPDSDFRNIIKIAAYIKDTTHKPIYVMSLPPLKNSVLIQMKNAGVTETAFNLEVFDRKLAQMYMPGKGAIALNVYQAALTEAVRLWGNRGSVRTIFIVGLEPKKSLLDGVRWACKMGVSPILSLFKPIEGTEMSHLLPPSDDEIIDIYENTLKICHEYGVELGPSCHYCEDNTIKVSME